MKPLRPKKPPKPLNMAAIHHAVKSAPADQRGAALENAMTQKGKKPKWAK